MIDIKEILKMFYCNMPFMWHKPKSEEIGYTKCCRCGVSLHISEDYITLLDPYCNCKDCISCNYYNRMYE